MPGTPAEGAMLVTTMVTVVPELLGVAGLGPIKQLDAQGTPVQVKFTGTLKPPWPVTMMVVVPVVPRFVVMAVEPPEGIVRVKSWPMPLKLTVCVLPAVPLLSSVMVSVPVRAPTAVGVNVTLMVQEAPAATLVPQVLV